MVTSEVGRAPCGGKNGGGAEVRVQFPGVALPSAIDGEVDIASTMSPRQGRAHPCPWLGRASKPVQQASALPIPAAETYTAHFTAGPAVQSNEVYPTPCTTVPSISFASASDKRYSLDLTENTAMSQRSTLSQVLGLVGCLAIVFIAAAIGAAASIEASTFYARLVRPAWAPPASAFGPVWSVLYLLMGIAAWLVWREHGASHRVAALALFIAQLCANSLWSWLFFAWRDGAVAFVEVLVLLALIAATLVAFWRISRLAGVLMLPYLAWVSLASALTWSVWQSNPKVL